jgi:hypothetical protein
MRPAMPGIGPSRHFASAQQLGRFWGEADINGWAGLGGSVAKDPQQTFRSVFVWFRNMRGGLLSVSSEAGDLSLSRRRLDDFRAGTCGNLALPGMLESNAITQEETVMRTLLLAGVLAVGGFAIATPISIAPASAQVAVETPLGGVRVGPEPRYYRDYDRPAYRAYGYDRGYRGCRTVTIERDDGSVRSVRRCD